MTHKTYIYIAGPYSKGDVVINIREAILAAGALREYGFIPYVPHLSMLWHMVEPHPIDYWYSLDLEWLEKCDCLIRLEGESSGADEEVKVAERLGIPVLYSIEQCVEYIGIRLRP